ncbi:erythromycin esterase family protein [Nocardia harenae]|uniref:erythromycin esterase family protein n=1 Tax=Nocardia harenae TaxID=358707 RepID=UPI0008295478|nr:erythromycin esterase family protein [Nocardia harenae]
MSQDIRDFLTPSCTLLGLGEPTHREPGFGFLRNDLFTALVRAGFRSIAVETDRVAALAVDDFVRDGIGTVDDVLRVGFSHGFGALEPNRELVVRLRAYNEGRPAGERLSFHGFDAPTENTTAPSPRSYLSYAADYLGLDIADFGPDDRWDRPEAILDVTRSIGDSAEAARLRALADDLLGTLHARAPELIAATSRAAWHRARTHLTAGIGVLRYHRQAARRVEESARISGLLATRDSIMAQNLLDIRGLEEDRGPTLVCADNGHLQRNPSSMRMAGMELGWWSAGAILDALLGARYRVLLGSLGSSATLGLGAPEPGTYEHALRRRFPAWGLTTTVAPALTRTDTRPDQGYAPLDQPLIEAADGVLYLDSGR